MRNLAEICKAAGDPLRLEVLRVLSHDTFGVQELAFLFKVPQPGMSHHLKVLAKAGWVESRRQGNSIFYRRVIPKTAGVPATVQQDLFRHLDEIPIPAKIVSRIETVFSHRSQASQRYFEKHAHEFAQHQGILCDLPQYLSNIRELLDLVPPSKRKSVALEIGPGSGGLLKELLDRYSRVIALDRSQEMLELTKVNVARYQGRTEFINGSLEEFPDSRKGIHLAVLNMVLHHVASPKNAFAKLSSLVEPSGYVLVADLCSHNQEWVRKSCGDVWLGFDPKDLKLWADETGFTELQAMYLGLKNGFQIQLKLFIKQ